VLRGDRCGALALDLIGHGTIEVGKKADLLLLDDTAHITDEQSI
jgi:cytosine/adenosine deaminase-related metal-dependent hydrolase